jgi:hypothetical protein
VPEPGTQTSMFLLLIIGYAIVGRRQSSGTSKSRPT